MYTHRVRFEKQGVLKKKPVYTTVSKPDKGQPTRLTTQDCISCEHIHITLPCCSPGDASTVYNQRRAGHERGFVGS